MIRSTSICLAVLFAFAAAVAAQTMTGAPEPELQGYLVGPGDKLEGKVLGEPEFDFTAVIDETGQFSIPFVDDPITAKCRTENDIRDDVKKKLEKYLKDPLVSVQVAERRTPEPVTVYGEVRNGSRVDLRRSATLLELLAFAGGVNMETAGGYVRVFRTRSLMCAEEGTKDDWLAETDGGLEVPSRTYTIGNIQAAEPESNPRIYPGDLIIVEKAPPVYVIGEVGAIREIRITQNGLSLSEAIAQAGGFRERAKEKEIVIRRLKAGSREREIITVNFKEIEAGNQQDVMLRPEDIVVVDKTKKSIAETIFELVTGSARNAANMLPQRVFF
ncbi:MAG TPA: polysaccharide biosynthesis/export family protein [Aridibacter sp.]|nr:polysaccharide biosynthesis/export family protein [Aridibacter sp.]